MIEVIYNGPTNWDPRRRHLIIRSPDRELLIVIDQLMAVRSGGRQSREPMPDSPSMTYDVHYKPKHGWYRIGWTWEP